MRLLRNSGILLAVVVAAVAATMSSGMTAASADVTLNDWLHVDQTNYVGGCIDDTLHTTGEVHRLSSTTVDGTGGVHYQLIRQTAVLKAEGTSGEQYVTNGNNPGLFFTDQRMEDTTGATVVTIRSTVNLISLGGSENLRSTLVSVLVLRPDGTVAREEPLHFEVACQG